ncbi:MAG: hypothetical protein CVV49_01350 [Spirochaetae bacterium HGW-Spirochaetae-5]|nr:MAG: hypothetical protein CVV49_01350 [Spirochaetae bacterium HGW-Spirochaetae-5]
MKNKAMITVWVIVFISAFLVLKNRGCGNNVPELEGLLESGDEINISGRDLSLAMVKKDNNWFINDQAYPGDVEKINSLAKKVRDLKLLDLVSDKGYYDKYDLTDEKGISVTIKEKGKVLRRLLVGKAGSTNNHSYLKIDDRKEIYLAAGIMKKDFILKVSDLRNKKIFDVKNPDIRYFSINYKGKNFDFKLNPLKSKTENGGNTEEGKSDPVNQEPKWLSRDYQKGKLSDAAINSILALFSPLEASDFPENATIKNAGNPLCKVVVAYEDKKAELVIYSKKENGMYYASSSENKDIFAIDSWKAEKLFIKSLTDLAVK